MSHVIEVRHQVAIAGKVTEARAGAANGAEIPVSNAVVEILRPAEPLKSLLVRKAMQYGALWEGMVERPDRTRTKPDGLFYFLDLPDGNYTIAVSVPRLGKRYGAGRANAKVSRTAKGKVNMAFLEISLQPTTVRGKVSGTRHGAGVMMAEIRMKGSGERTFSNEAGEYALKAVEPGKRTILVSAQGYRDTSKVVTIEQPGALAVVNFELSHDAAG